jgi:hypothetical protein
MHIIERPDQLQPRTAAAQAAHASGGFVWSKTAFAAALDTRRNGPEIETRP